MTCPASVTYTGSAQEPCSANVTGAGGLDESVLVTYSDNTNAGTATASASYGGDANHKPSGDSKTFAIEKADSTTTVTCPQRDLHGSAQSRAPRRHRRRWDQSLPDLLGQHERRYGTACELRRRREPHVQQRLETFAIEKADSTTIVTCPVSVTYTGSAQEPCTAKVTGAGGLNQSLSVSYSSNTDAGTATANAGYAGDANHKPSDDSKTFTIEKAARPPP